MSLTVVSCFPRAYSVSMNHRIRTSHAILPGGHGVFFLFFVVHFKNEHINITSDASSSVCIPNTTANEFVRSATIRLQIRARFKRGKIFGFEQT